MKLTICQCDKCGADCSEYEEMVLVSFPYGERHDLCIKCAREIFPDKKEDNVAKSGMTLMGTEKLLQAT